MSNTWKKNSWRNLPIKQQPNYQDKNLVTEVEKKLEKLPPLVFAGEVKSLRKKLAKVYFEELENIPLITPAQNISNLNIEANLLTQISKKDFLMYTPYHSFSYLLSILSSSSTTS